MRVFLGIVILGAAFGLTAAFFGCGGDAEPIHAKCKNFCEGLISAMDDSDNYDISNKSEAEQACLRECTDSIEGINDKKLQDDVEDCVECVGDEAGSGSDWEDFEDAYMEDCYDECYDDDADDPDPWSEFYNDFMEDFSEHYSNGDGGDVDTDSDTDSDCDLDAYEDCVYDYADCYYYCEDQECMDACLDEFCDCASWANCDDYASEYGC